MLLDLWTAKWIFILISIRIMNCTEEKPKMEGFVVGGDYVSILKAPHAAFLSLHCWDMPGMPATATQALCGSTVLNQKIILTAAHCLEGCDPKSKLFYVYTLVGHADIAKATIKRNIVDLKIHQDYNEVSVENDVAVAVIKGTFPLGSNVKRVMISRQFPEPYKLANTFVAGWGIVDEAPNAHVTGKLKKVRQRLRSVETCAQIGKLHKGMFCAGSTVKSDDHASAGDSGSALVTMDGIEQIGMVSFRILRLPALMAYSNISFYYHWISSNAQILYCKNKG